MKTLVFDTESTGKNEPVIIEAAWAEITSIDNVFALESSFHQRYNPGKPIEVGAIAVHHILDDELENCPASSTFMLPADTAYLIGHNIDYDWTLAGKPDVKRICTLALCRALWPLTDNHTQGAMLYYLSADRVETRRRLKDAHSAVADVENCLEILHHIIAALNVFSWDDLWVESEKARIPKLMSFGKHKGEAIKDIPESYKTWLLGQPDVDPYLAQALGANA